VDEDVANGDVRLGVDQFGHGVECGEGVVELGGFGEGVNGVGEDGLGVGAGEDGGRAGAGVGGDEVEEGTELGEAVGGGEGAGHPVEGGVGVAEGVERGGGPGEEVEVELGEGGVVVELRFQEVKESVWAERRGPMGPQEIQEAGVVNWGHGRVWRWRGKREVADRRRRRRFRCCQCSQFHQLRGHSLLLNQT